MNHLTNREISALRKQPTKEKTPNKSNTTHYPKQVPGNSTYSRISNEGKKCAIFTDSICRRIDMKEFNNYIINGNAFMKTFIGASPDELHHYMEKHLDEERPDTCIINVGTNRLGKDDAFKIAEDIIKCVDRCRKFDVNKILVSAITYRPAYRELIKTG